MLIPPHSEYCLLMNFTEMTVFQEANFKCHETFTEADAIKRIQKSLSDTFHYKYFIVEMDE